MYLLLFLSCRIEAVSEAKPDLPTAFYLAGTQDGSRPGKCYINCNNLRDRYLTYVYIVRICVVGMVKGNVAVDLEIVSHIGNMSIIQH